MDIQELARSFHCGRRFLAFDVTRYWIGGQEAAPGLFIQLPAVEKPIDKLHDCFICKFIRGVRGMRHFELVSCGAFGSGGLIALRCDVRTGWLSRVAIGQWRTFPLPPFELRVQILTYRGKVSDITAEHPIQR